MTRLETGLLFLCCTIILQFFEVQGNSVSSRISLQESPKNGCECQNYSCGCCEHMESERIHLNSTGCVNLTYLVQDYGISFTVTLNNWTIYNETISAHNPPPVCIAAPYLEEYAELCVKFYDLTTSHHKLHGCIKVEGRIKHLIVSEYDFGCFDIPGKKWFKKKEKKQWRWWDNMIN